MKVSGPIYIVVLFALTALFILPSAAKRKQRDMSSDARLQYMLLEAFRLENLDSITATFDVLRRAAEIDTANADVKYQLAMYYFPLQQPQIAYSYMLSAAEGSPDNYWYNVTAANLAGRIGDNERAVALFRKLMDNNPGDEEILEMLAEAYVNSGMYDEALESYDKLEKMTGNMEYVVTAKVEIFKSLKQNDKVLAELKRLSRAYPENVEYLLGLGTSYVDSDSMTQAMDAILRAETIEPEDYLIYIAKAYYYNKKGESDSLRVSVYNALSREDISLEIKQVLLKDYLYSLLQKDKDVKSFQKADTLFNSIIESYPRDIGVRKFYSDILLMQHKSDKAEEHLRVALDLDSADVDVWKKLIGVLYEKGDYALMSQSIDKALDHVKGDSTFILAAGSYYFFSKHEHKAIDLLKKGIIEFNNSPMMLSELYAQLGDMYYQIGMRDSSFIFYDSAVYYNPDNLGALNNYSYYITLVGGDLSKAEKMSAVTIKSEPNNPTYLDTYGWIFFKQGNYTIAELYIRKAMQSAKEVVPDIFEHYGDILSKEGRVEEAVEYWRKALEAGSTSTTIEKKIKGMVYTE